MAAGAGKFGEHTERLLKELDAHAVVLIVLGENSAKSGFDVAAIPEGAGTLVQLPALLRYMADQIDKDITKNGLVVAVNHG